MRSSLHALGLSVLPALLISGCAQAPDVIALRFDDELVEAPARNVAIAVVSDTSCTDLLTLPHESLEDVATVISRTRTRYPIDPDLGALDFAPRGRPLSVDVSVLDAEDRQISRACDTITLPASEPATLTLQMHGLAPCAEAPTSLDLTLVLDLSLGMRDANVGLDNALIDSIKTFVQNLGVPGGSVRFSIVTHGPELPMELLSPTYDKEVVLQTLENQRNVAGGSAHHYEALALGGAVLRDQAVCGLRPALLWVGGGPDESDPASFQIAAVELSGTRGEGFDDIFVFGLGVSAEAVDAMRLLIDDLDLARLQGALTVVRLQDVLRSVHSDLQGLLP